MTTRPCLGTCSQILPLDSFPKKGRGHGHVCKSCIATRTLTSPSSFDTSLLQKLSLLDTTKHDVLTTRISSLETHITQQRTLMETHINHQQTLMETMIRAQSDTLLNTIRSSNDIALSEIHTLTSHVNLISTKVSDLTLAHHDIRTLFAQFQDTLSDNNQSLFDRINSLFTSQSKQFDDLKSDISQISSPSVSGLSSLTGTPTSAVSPQRHPVSTTKPPSSKHSDSFRNKIITSILTDDFIRSIPDSDLRKSRDNARTYSSKAKRDGLLTDHSIAQRNVDLLTLEMDRRAPK
jgi:phage-related protein